MESRTHINTHVHVHTFGRVRIARAREKERAGESGREWERRGEKERQKSWTIFFTFHPNSSSMREDIIHDRVQAKADASLYPVSLLESLNLEPSIVRLRKNPLFSLSYTFRRFTRKSHLNTLEELCSSKTRMISDGQRRLIFIHVRIR